MGRHAAGDSPAMDRLVDDAIVGVGREIEALRVPRLRGVVLGGGYGRGEGGVFVGADGSERLSNDLDFYVVADGAATGRDIDAIGAALAPVADRWTRRLGVDVDFCRAKTPWRLRHDQERVMVQELLHGYFDVAGESGESLFAGVERREPSSFPWMEAARLLMNRGVGLMLAREKGEGEFAARNVNKCVLGAGDAVLIARGGYEWKAEDRAAKLCRPLYSAAVGWKFRPKAGAVCDWEAARREWLDAFGEVERAGRGPGTRRTAYSALRWLARRRTLGEAATLGLDPVVRVLMGVRRAVEGRAALPPRLVEDWRVFN